MKLKFIPGILICCLLGLWIPISAQTINSADINAFTSQTRATISFNKSTGAAGFVRFPREDRMVIQGNSLEEKVSFFLQQYGHVLGISDPDNALQFFKTETDFLGHRHLYYEQMYHGIPVFGGDFRFHFDEQSRLSAVNGVFVPNIESGIFPLLSEDVAALIALDHVGNQDLNVSGVPLEIQHSKIYLFRKGLVQGVPGANHLVYEMEVGNKNDVLEYVYVDAIKGTIVDQFTGVHAILSRRVYEDNTGNLVWDEGNAFPGSLSIWQQNEVQAAGHAYYLFAHAFGFDSYNNAGAMMRTINNNPNISCPNANWNGSTTNFCNGTAADDVVAHEWGHAYTSYTSGLIYAWQSGALNESYSDIWGETVDLLNEYQDAGENLSNRTSCNSSDKWMIGEDASAFGGAIRDMWNPNCKSDPGKVTDNQYSCGSGDSGGVHTNSGINNHAYALLVDGGNYNGQSISALGLTKTAHIFWRAQSVYLTSTSDFSAQADALEMACSDLVGVNLEGLSTGVSPAGLSGQIITVADCNEVAEVNEAVEFRQAPACGFSNMLASNPPELCPDGKFQYDIATQDFETGLGTWSVVQVPENSSTWENHDWEIITNLPENRPGAGIYGADLIIGDCFSDLENGIIRLRSPLITIPLTTSDPVLLAFDHYASMELNWDGGNVKYKLNNGPWTVVPASAFIFNPYNGTLNGGDNDNPMGGEPAFTGADEGSVSGSWGQSQINLTQLGAHAGDNLRLRWELGTDGCNGWDGWYLDDIVVCSCEASLPVTLVDFTARAHGNDVLLDWKTESEFNNAGFEVQRKMEGDDLFESIGWVEGNGTSQQSCSYQFRDKSLQNGKTYYYRLQQLDFDGRRMFSEVVAVSIGNGTGTGFTIVPNPAKDRVSLHLNGTIGGAFECTIVDLNGKVVWQTREPEALQQPIEVSLWPSGLYFVSVKGEKIYAVQRLVID